MALTTAEKNALFQILDVPMFTTYKTISGVGSLSVTTDLAAVGATAAKTAIETHLTALATDSALEDELQALIAEWVATGLNVTEVTSGGIADISGVSFSSDRKRELIRERVKLIVPFFRAHEIAAKEAAAAASAGGMVINVIR